MIKFQLDSVARPHQASNHQASKIKKSPLPRPYDRRIIGCPQLVPLLKMKGYDKMETSGQPI